ncbi:MAG: hypothetical protein J6Y67_07340 [Lachnospiraceae bacterium]|nr:hypothetical protein [Lachnospiraceae bacterium]
MSYVIMNNGNLYHAGEPLGKYAILSKDKLFPDAKPRFNSGYMLEIDPAGESVLEYFDIDYIVEYDTGIEGAPTEWQLNGTKESDISGGVVWIHGDNYPGWEVIDRAWSRKKIALHECTGLILKKTVYYCGGRKLSRPRVKRVRLSADDFKRAFRFYEEEDFRVLSEYEGEPFLF